ncbi:fluoride efflux transporter CrcB [Priestia megaterium]|nr:fluoride efflux transporter CrcB [Priestia megaterium]
MSVFCLALGGALGAVCRYLLGVKITKKFPHPPFPIAMLIVNIIGSLGLGIFYGVYYHEIPKGAYDDLIFLTIGIGFFGAFTTFSTFSIEAVQLLRRRSYKQLVFYISCSVVGTIGLFLIGMIMITRLILL